MVSVIVPVYNRVNTIERCLNSIVRQSYTDWEIIVVDDGSDDGSVELVYQYIHKQNKNIKLLQQKHMGAQSARNRGIRNASGEWIAFLDSDDEWCLDYLAEVVPTIEKNIDAVVCTKCYCASCGKQRSVWNFPGKSGNIYSYLLERPWPMFQGMLVAKTSLENIGLLDEKCVAYQEWDTAIRLAKIYRYIFIDKPLFIYYRDKNTNAISNDLKKNNMAYEYILEKHRDAIVGVCGEKTLRHHYGILLKKSRGRMKWHYFKLIIKNL